ncbi:MAG TPA: hypothetical protein VF120_02495 [Ktedonobacterales bacterium]
MAPQEYSNNYNTRPATLGSNFSADEVARLMNLRHNFHAHAEYVERVIDQRRLEFARWLRDNGKLSEACPEA